MLAAVTGACGSLTRTQTHSLPWETAPNAGALNGAFGRSACSQPSPEAHASPRLHAASIHDAGRHPSSGVRPPPALSPGTLPFLWIFSASIWAQPRWDTHSFLWISPHPPAPPAGRPPFLPGSRPSTCASPRGHYPFLDLSASTCACLAGAFSPFLWISRPSTCADCWGRPPPSSSGVSASTCAADRLLCPQHCSPCPILLSR